MDQLEALYRREHGPMVNLAHLLVGDRAEAEELVHDAFLRVAPHLDGQVTPGAYLRTTVVNLCRDHHRRNQRARAHRRERAAVEPAPDVPLTSTAVWRALHRLPERQRTALVLRYFVDLAVEDIATLIDARPGTVRSLVHRGLASLKEVVRHD